MKWDLITDDDDKKASLYQSIWWIDT